MFPSPIGVLYISMKERKRNENYTHCFRPLLGFFIFQCLSNYRMNSTELFPSPIGVLYISMKRRHYRVAILRIVSVPYWGSLYFNEIKKRLTTEDILFPSPIGVLYISIEKKKPDVDVIDLFPSPIGVLYISIRYFQSYPIFCKFSFRPLLGFFIFQCDNMSEKFSTARAVSVPYWGSLYFNDTAEVLFENESYSFRPLLGFFIFQ